MGEEKVKLGILELDADTEKKSKAENTKVNDRNKNTKKAKRSKKPSSEEDSDYSCNNDNNEDDSDNENTSINQIKSRAQVDQSKSPTVNGDCDKEFRVKSTNQEFKLRLVPLERLLSSSRKAQIEKEKGQEKSKEAAKKLKLNSPEVVRKQLPQRSNRKNYSVIEISSSDEDDLALIEEVVVKPKQTAAVRSRSPTVRGAKSTSQQKKTTGIQSLRVKRCVVRLKRTPWPAHQKLPQTIKKSSKTKSNEKALRSRSPSTSTSVSAAAVEKQAAKKGTRSRLPSSSSSTYVEKPAAKVTSKKTKKSRSRSRSTSSSLPTAAAAKSVAKTAKQTRSRSSSSSSSSSTPAAEERAAEKTSKPTGNINKRRISSDSESDMEKASSTRKRKKTPSDADSCSDSDFEIEKAAAAASKRNSTEADEDSEDNDGGKSSDSEVVPVRRKRVFTKKASDSNDSDFEPQGKRPPKAKKPRRRIRNNNSDDGDDDDGDEKNKNKRKHIRKIIKTKDLDISTKEATKEEEERRKRIEERQKLYNQIYERAETKEITELILDFDEESKEALLQVDTGLLKKLKPHQVAGVKFMWDACYETIADAVEKPGSGCILAHCMGLGKTLQVVALAHTLLTNTRKTQVERVLIISPLSTLNNWAREFEHWMSFARKKNIEIYDMSKYKDKNTRIFKLDEWYEEGGVCILGYDMYRILTNEKAKGLRKKQREALQRALVDPGPDLVICDEGHLLKNEKTSISKAVTRMRTKRRIVLTGTPLQNNLKEYYCMIQFVKPNLLGTYKEYLNRFVNPITNGQYTDSTERDIRLMKHRSHILHKLLEGCIQRRDYSVLAPYLPPKHEYVVYTTLSEVQQQLYEYYMTTQRDVNTTDLCGKGARLFQDFQDLRRIWTHPMSLRVNSDIVIRKRLMADEEDSLEDFICDDEDDEENGGGGRKGRGREDDSSSSDDSSVGSIKSYASGAADGSDGGGSGVAAAKARRTRSSKQQQQQNGNVDEDSELVELKDGSLMREKDDPSEWWKRFVDESELNNLNHSPKLVILMQLLQQCEAIGDKLLVFSQSLQSLDVIEHFLSLIDSKTHGFEYEGNVGDLKGEWKPGIDYFRLDGSCSVENRDQMCKRFNDPKNLRARLFLISTRAGGLGINLVAANRVVIFDVSWNPSHDTQSIFRVYRFGQDKPCYIYRLIAMGTMEQKVYERQVTKQATAKRVIDEQQISRHYNQSDLQELYTYELKPTAPRALPNLPKDRLFAELLSEYETFLYKYHEHDSLLENEESENLSEEDRKAAWSEYEAEKTRATQTAQYISYDRSAYSNPSGSVTSNRIFGFRSDVLLQLLNMKVSKDNPEFTQTQILQLVPEYLTRLYNEMNQGDPTMYKELLVLNSALTHPSGMYMNPLLYANQNPGAAGYYQAPHQQQQPQPLFQPTQGMMPQAAAAPGFNSNEVYEID